MGGQLAARAHQAMAKYGMKRTASRLDTSRNAASTSSTAGTVALRERQERDGHRHGEHDHRQRGDVVEVR